MFNHREYSWCSTCIIFYVETAKSYLEGHGLQCQGNLKANRGVLCFETVAIAHLSKGPGDLKQNGTQEKTPFSSNVFNTLSHGVIRFLRVVAHKTTF